MTLEQNVKIESGVVACLDKCRGTDRPYMALSAFLNGLQADTDWSDSEVIELQTRIIRLLLHTQNPTAQEPMSDTEPMPEVPKVKCPQCGSTDVTLVKSLTKERTSKRPALMPYYQCACGVGFTVTIKPERLPGFPVTGVRDSKTG